MKKKIILMLLLILPICLCSCSKETETDAKLFMEEYESVNGEKSGTNTIRELNISEDNPFIYKEAKDIVKAIENDETFIVYFGFSTCPWCRSVLPSLIKTAKENDIEEIYYVDVKEIRNTIEYDAKMDFLYKETKKGSEDYSKLLDLLSDVLSDYKLTDDKGNSIYTGQKRIYAPNVVVVNHGKAIGMASGISELQTDSYMELNKEITNDIESKFNELFDLLNGDTCTSKEGC